MEKRLFYGLIYNVLFYVGIFVKILVLVYSFVVFSKMVCIVLVWVLRKSSNDFSSVCLCLNLINEKKNYIYL